MVNISDRWNRDKTDDLQFAFFNGVGWESWENIWGIWNGITPRDAEATRRVATIERAHGAVSGKQRVGAVRADACASASSPAAGRSGEQTVWTIVNRNEYDVDGRADRSCPPQTACVTSICITAWRLKPTRSGDKIRYFQLRDRGERTTARFWRTKSAPDAEDQRADGAR